MHKFLKLITIFNKFPKYTLLILSFRHCKNITTKWLGRSTCVVCTALLYYNSYVHRRTSCKAWVGSSLPKWTFVFTKLTFEHTQTDNYSLLYTLSQRQTHSLTLLYSFNMYPMRQCTLKSYTYMYIVPTYAVCCMYSSVVHKHLSQWPKVGPSSSLRGPIGIGPSV